MSAVRRTRLRSSTLRLFPVLAALGALAACSDDTTATGSGGATAGTTTATTSVGSAAATTTTTGGDDGADASSTGAGASGGDGPGGSGSTTGGGAGGEGSGGSSGGGDACCGAIGPSLDELRDSGPIVLESGMTVSGLRITNPDGPCITGDGVSDVTIENNLIGPCGPTAQGVGVGLAGASDVRVRNNAFDDVASALYVNGNGGGGEAIEFDHNVATRIRGPGPRGQLVQLNTVVGRGIRIVCNVSDQTLPGYLEGPEDHISVYRSEGTVESPILIANNRLRGGGPSDSGGGIMTGDNGSKHVEVRGNVLVSPGQYGIAIAGGESIRLVGNVVYAPEGFDWSNVGVYVWKPDRRAGLRGPRGARQPRGLRQRRGRQQRLVELGQLRRGRRLGRECVGGRHAHRLGVGRAVRHMSLRTTFGGAAVENVRISPARSRPR